MALMKRFKPDAAVLIPVVVAIHKNRHPIADLIFADKRTGDVAGGVGIDPFGKGIPSTD